jgi:hypothetical protein
MGANRAERLADKLVTAFSDFRVDVRQAGRYFARLAPRNVYEQFDEFVQGAEIEMTERNLDEGEAKNVYRFFKEV